MGGGISRRKEHGPGRQLSWDGCGDGRLFGELAQLAEEGQQFFARLASARDGQVQPRRRVASEQGFELSAR